MKKVILPLFAVFLLVSACQSKESTQTTNQETHTETVTQNQSEVWIDVRSKEEFDSGHLQNALHIPHEEIGGKIAQLVPNKSAKINLYCRSGRRAEIAKKTLTDLGYQNVVNQGGYEDLRKKGYQ
ncbi:MAG: rhodanese-like domain-containing protein [Moraxella sp.]